MRCETSRYYSRETAAGHTRCQEPEKLGQKFSGEGLGDKEMEDGQENDCEM